MPTLVAVYGLYTDKCSFRPFTVPMLDTRDVSKRFTRSFVMTQERAEILAKYVNIMHTDGKKLAS